MVASKKSGSHRIKGKRTVAERRPRRKPHAVATQERSITLDRRENRGPPRAGRSPHPERPGGRRTARMLERGRRSIVAGRSTPPPASATTHRTRSSSWAQWTSTSGATGGCSLPVAKCWRSSGRWATRNVRRPRRRPCRPLTCPLPPVHCPRPFDDVRGQSRPEISSF